MSMQYDSPEQDDISYDPVYHHVASTSASATPPSEHDDTDMQHRLHEFPESSYLECDLTGHYVVEYKWPKTIGIVQIILGMIITCLGVLELLIIPIAEGRSDEHVIIIGKRNGYGAGIFAGVVMLLTGSTAVRASITKRRTTITRFFTLTTASLLVYTGFVVLLIYGYSHGWTSKSQFPDGSFLYEMHIFVTIAAFMGLLFTLTSFIRYYETICFGDAQLFKRLTHGCCPCCLRSNSSSYRQIRDHPV